jgi:hypothetical protein
MGKKDKSPKSKRSPRSQKNPARATSPESRYNEKPVWMVGSMDFDGPFGWKQVDRADTLLAIHERLRNFESMTWGDLKDTGSHSVALDQLSPDARKRLEEIQLDDLGQLFSLRIAAKERVWGYYSGSALKILWWDPDHLVCPSLKKHT